MKRVTPPQETPGITSAREAAVRSREGFVDAVEVGIEGRKTAERMHRLREENHWGELIQKVYLS